MPNGFNAVVPIDVATSTAEPAIESSTSIVFPGQTALCNGSGVARVSHRVQVDPKCIDVTASAGSFVSKFRPAQVTHKQVVSPAVIGQLQPGAQVPVKVDPNDHSQLMIGLAG